MKQISMVSAAEDSTCRADLFARPRDQMETETEVAVTGSDRVAAARAFWLRCPSGRVVVAGDARHPTGAALWIDDFLGLLQ